MKKVLVTGASGYLGLPLVSILAKSNYKVYAVGRNKKKLRHLFPSIDCFSYNELFSKKLSFDYIIHLAVANNDQELDEKAFYITNVKLLSDLLSFAKRSRVTKFFNFTSFHVFTKKTNPYVRTKQQAIKLLDSVDGFSTHNIFLPAIYCDNHLKGKLKILSKFPRIMRIIAIYILSSIAPLIRKESVCLKTISLIGLPKPPRNNYFYDDQDRNIIFRTIKLFVDLSFSLIVIILFFWLLVIISLLIKLNSKGTIFFTQERVGERGRIFKIYKFRTMQMGTKNMGTHKVEEEKITSLGKFLRKAKLDELPQIINIFLGQMSLIGPRPGLVSQKILYRERKMRDVYSVKPGISGYSQLNNVDMSEPKKIAEWDQRYVAMRSVVFEFKLMFQTLTDGFGDRTKRK